MRWKMAVAGRRAETEVLPLLVAVVACTVHYAAVMAIKMVYNQLMQSPVDGLSPFRVA